VGARPADAPQVAADAETSGATWIFEAFGVFEAAPAAQRRAGTGRKHGGLTRRRWALAGVVGGLAAAATGIFGLVAVKASPGEVPRPAARPVPIPSGTAAAAPGPAAAQPAALPVALTIPAIDVRTKLIRLGVTAQGSLQVPQSTSVAGWYTGSPRPGAVGSSVIAGHIDSYQGPGVFFRLRLLRPGNLVYVREASGKLAVFRVTSVRMYPKDHFPTAAVYGPSPDAELRLITCGGVFDHVTGSYLSNVVAYTTEVS
jgi:sortase (surface protein transpeptidase)